MPPYHPIVWILAVVGIVLLVLILTGNAHAAGSWSHNH